MGQVGQLLIPIALMIALLIAGMLVFVWIRRRFLDDAPSEQGAGLTLHQLRTLKAEGKLSDQEYEAARAAILGQAPPKTPPDQAPPDTPNPPKAPDRGE